MASLSAASVHLTEVFDRGQVENHSIPSHNLHRSVERIVKSGKTVKIVIKSQKSRAIWSIQAAWSPVGLRRPHIPVISMSFAVACQSISVWERFSWRTPVSVTFPASSSVWELSDTHLARLSWCAPAHLLWFSSPQYLSAYCLIPTHCDWIALH